ncbi:unnamed protein product [Linum trigynum]|uniref:Uncharacterized protein n=1 Tax=Linum trigynum TaxID=586398 RepID=A0AAV2FYA6_9ROSI
MDPGESAPPLSPDPPSPLSFSSSSYPSPSPSLFPRDDELLLRRPVSGGTEAESSSINVRLSRPPATIESASKGDAPFVLSFASFSAASPAAASSSSVVFSCRSSSGNAASLGRSTSASPGSRVVSSCGGSLAAFSSANKSSSPDATVSGRRMAAGSTSYVLPAAADEDFLLGISTVSRPYLNQTSNSSVSKSDLILILVSKHIHRFSPSNGRLPHIVMMPEEYTTCALLNPGKRTNTRMNVEVTNLVTLGMNSSYASIPD